MRLFAKYYENCSQPVYHAGRSAVLRARRAGCPRNIFSLLKRNDTQAVMQMSRFGDSFFDHLFMLDIIHCVTQWCAFRSILRMIKESEDKQIIRASSSLLVFIYCQIAAVRLLVINGLDTQARAACRPLREATSLLVLVQNNSDLANEFVSAENPEEANVFWKKHVRTGKTKRSHLEEIFGSTSEARDMIEESIQYIKGEEFYFSQAIHPSYIAGVIFLFSFFDEKEDDEEGWELLSQSPSIRTMKYAKFNCANGLLAYLLNSEIRDADLFSENEKKFIGQDENAVREAMIYNILTVASAMHQLDRDGSGRRP